MSAHTPGPWGIDSRGATVAHGYAHKARSESHSIHGPAGKHQLIATLAMRANGDNAAQARADARLIAAAPELLTALQELVEVANYRDGGAKDGALQDARAAIAKARP